LPTPTGLNLTYTLLERRLKSHGRKTATDR
jgi:hypothetical protein